MPSPAPVKPFDASLKSLWEANPTEYARSLTGTPGPAETIDADVAAVSGAADKVIRVGRGKKQLLLAVEFQASYKPELPERTHWHSALLEHRHDRSVKSVILLLRPEADGPAMTGTFARQLPDEVEPYRTFRYEVIRLWQLPPEVFLSGGGSPGPAGDGRGRAAGRVTERGPTGPPAGSRDAAGDAARRSHAGDRVRDGIAV